MGIDIKIYGADESSDEYEAALRLKKIIETSITDNADGSIILFVNATFFGQIVKDVDIMLIGQIKNYRTKLCFRNEQNKNVEENVSIGSFCTTIEVKSHDISGIFWNGTDFYVKYGNDSHCVTSQSNKQKIAAKNYFENAISISPYITNVIWFTQVTENELTSLCRQGNKKLVSNVMSQDVNFNDLLQLLAYQKPPFRTDTGYRFDANNCIDIDEINRALMQFGAIKQQMGEMTRKKIEQIFQKSFCVDIVDDNLNDINILRGRAGTGKTVGLIQTAIRLVEEQKNRVLLLTYNMLLVSDIRRLFSLAELPDMFQEQCIFINTMHSFFYKICNVLLFGNQMHPQKFLENYEQILSNLYQYLSEDEQWREIMRHDINLCWDYVLIDDAQDWSDLESAVIMKIFNNGNIIVADGGQQIVRNQKHCDWAYNKRNNSIKLKYCLRQKQNLVRFLNKFSESTDILNTKILSSENMYGGCVKIIPEKDVIDLAQIEIDKLKDYGNIPYDMLYLVPHSMAKISETVIKDFAENDVLLWDGTKSINREKYPTNPNYARMIQYDSARGLEGWTVFCLEFDVFLSEKANEYVDDGMGSLFLESPEEKRKKFVYNWAMIALTRAIDTIIITLKDENSDVGRLLRQLAAKNNDYVQWIDR